MPDYPQSSSREHLEFQCYRIPEDAIHVIGHMDGVVFSLQYFRSCLMPAHCSPVLGALGTKLWAIQLQVEWMGGWTFGDLLQVMFVFRIAHHCRKKLCQ